MTEGISNRQLFFIIIISVAGFSAVKLPQIMGNTARTGAWFTLLLAAVFFAANALIITYLAYVYKGKSLFEYSRLLTGKVITFCFSAIYILYFFVMMTFIVRSSSDIIKAEILYKTPIWATMLLILAISLYAASKGLTNIGRIVEYLGLIILITGFTLHFIAFTQGNLLNMLPLFDPGEKNLYFNALPSAIFCFLGFDVITIMPFSKSNGVKALWTAVLSIFVLCIFYIIIVESGYIILSVDDIVNYDYPLIITIRRLDIAILQFAKRLDLFFIMAWLSAIFCSVCMVSFTVTEYIKKLIPKSNGRLILLIIGVLSFFTGMFIPNAEDASRLFIRFNTYLGLVPAFAIPLALLLIHFCKKPKRR